MHHRLEVLVKELREMGLLVGVGSLLSWDQETYMPSGAIGVRSEQSALLASLVHEKMTGDRFSGILSELIESNTDDFSDSEKRLLTEVHRDWKRAICLPTSFVSEYSQLVSHAQHIWQEAREKSDFGLFEPYLEKLVEKSREKAAYIDRQKPAYDVLLDTYEPGMTTAYLTPLFAILREGLVDILNRIKPSELTLPDRVFPVEKQWEYGVWFLTQMGFDFSRGRQDKSTHPFTTQFHPHDVRITTRLDANHVMDGFSSTVHEGGHALYEQGLDPAWFGTPLGEAMSLGIHESQSRMWENQIAKSASFWKGQYGRFQALFPDALSDINWETFYKTVNRVKPSLIRVDADEVTYNLHILIRYELEIALMDGTLKVSDLPAAWNQKYEDYLGICPPDASQGVLQDVHWSCGLFGYFPTYTLGNLYAAQFFEKMKEEIVDLDGCISRADFAPITAWLRKNIHGVGRAKTPQELVKDVTGKSLSQEAFIRYLLGKYLG